MKAFNLNHKAKIYFYSEPVRMSNGFPGLIRMAKDGKVGSIESGDAFVFVNEKRTYLKILFFHAGGFCLFCKVVPKHSQFEPEGLSGQIKLAEMEKLINQVVVHGARKNRRLKSA